MWTALPRSRSIALADGTEHTYFALPMDYSLPVSSSALHDVHIIATAPQGQLTSVMNGNGQMLASLVSPLQCGQLV